MEYGRRETQAISMAMTITLAYLAIESDNILIFQSLLGLIAFIGLFGTENDLFLLDLYGITGSTLLYNVLQHHSRGYLW